MTAFSPEDWFSNNIPNWTRWLEGLRGKNIDALEIGSYEGRSACWLLEHVLTHKRSTLLCVDRFIQDQLAKNLDAMGARGRVALVQMPSSDFWRSKHNAVRRDLIYIDGSHAAKDVLEDSVHAIHALRPGGILIWDDYRWTNPEAEWDRPGPVIDTVLSAYRNEIQVLDESSDAVNPGWQIAVRKVA